MIWVRITLVVIVGLLLMPTVIKMRKQIKEDRNED